MGVYKYNKDWGEGESVIFTIDSKEGGCCR